MPVFTAVTQTMGSVDSRRTRGNKLLQDSYLSTEFTSLQPREPLTHQFRDETTSLRRNIEAVRLSIGCPLALIILQSRARKNDFCAMEYFVSNGLIELSTSETMAGSTKGSSPLFFVCDFFRTHTKERRYPFLRQSRHLSIAYL